jgi:uncharacterized membrane protein
MLDPSITFAHVLTGTLAIAAGAAALIARKGAQIHVKGGTVFVAAMGFSSLLGAALGLMDAANFYITFHAGVLGVTLIASSWLTVRAKDGRLGGWNKAVSLANFVNAASLLTLGVLATQADSGRFLGFAASSYFFLFAMTALAAVGDISLLFRKALSRTHKIARHLWRMCLSFFIAAGSAFTGPGAEVFPEAVRQSGLLSLPELLILLALLFWLAHTYWSGRSRS